MAQVDCCACMQRNAMLNQSESEKTAFALSEAKPWRKYYKVGSEDATLSAETIYRQLKRESKKAADKPALYYYGTEITYGELLAKIDRCADAYASLGVKAGDVVSFVSAALPETVISLYALNKIGAVSSFIDPRMDVERVRYFTEKVDSKVLVVLESALPKVLPWLEQTKAVKILIQSPATDLPFFARLLYRRKNPAEKLPADSRVERFPDFIKNAGQGRAKEQPYTENAPCVYTQTGGTTGIPKCVVLTNEGFNAVALGFRCFGIDARPGDSFLDIMPIFSSYGIVCGIHMTLTMNFKVFLIPDFTPQRFPKLIRKYRPNHLLAVPAFYEKLTNDPKIRKMDLSFVLSMGSGGDTMTREMDYKLNTFFREHGVRYPIAQGYGMSEVSSAATFGQGFVNKPMSVGIPIPMVTVGIFHPETGEEMPVGESGEICISGPGVMKEYLDDAAATADLIRIHPDGKRWVHSGDIGHMDADGFLFVSGRIKQMITRFDGHKLFPAQIESVIQKYEGVKNCVVVPVKDREHGQGELPLAVVEMKPGVEVKTACRKILAYCNEIMEERGRPCAVTAMADIPLTSVGKCDRKAVTVLYKDYNYTV